MRTEFHSDNGKPCWKCSGTIFTYTTDSEVSLVDVKCIGCGNKDLFTHSRPLLTAADCSAAHRGYDARIGR